MPTKNPYGNTYIADLPEPETITAEEILESIDNKSIDLVCVLGPTASGKTKYAVELARELNRLRAEKYGATSVNATGAVNAAGAEILSGDSRQVYRGMDIGTGKDLNEYGEIPYHLIDIVDAGTKFDLYQYQKAFEKAYKDIVDRGGIPILCGGSGLYLEAATCGYSIPDVPPSPELRAELEEKSMDELVSMLASMKPLHNKTDIDTKKKSHQGIGNSFVAEGASCGEHGVPAEEHILHRHIGLSRGEEQANRCEAGRKDRGRHGGRGKATA